MVLTMGMCVLGLAWLAGNVALVVMALIARRRLDRHRQHDRRMRGL